MKIDKYIKKLVGSLLALVITFSTLIGCSPSGDSTHEHTFASFWVTNDEYHWHPSTCGHDVKGDEGRHEFASETNENGDTVYTCSICDYSYSDGNNDDKDTYTVTWKNYDGTILEVDNDVESGTMPSYDGKEPIKASDDRYDYTFAGWTPELEPVTEDITYTAVFSSEEITYTVTWKNYDGTVLEIDENVSYGTTPTYDGATPVKASDDRYDYTFAGWTPEVGPVTEDITYTAVFTSEEITYTVTWKNYDGTILEVDNDVSYGTTPTYDGATPIKESDDRYDYYFAGWTPDVGPVIKDTTYTATFSSEEITYTIDFDLNGGTSSSYKGPIEVKTFSKDIFFFDCVKEDWQFRGWEYNGEKIFDEKGNQLKNVTLVDNMVFRAIYSQTVKLTITTNMPEAGTITGEGEYPYNTYVDVSVTPNQGYKFVGWYYQNTLLSNEENYKYMMWDIDITLEARFERDDFNLRIYTNNEDYGLVLWKFNPVVNEYKPEYSGLEEYGSEVTIAAYSKSDVRFLGWYDENNELVTTNAVYTFVMPNYDYTLEAKWNYFTINYNLNGGVNNPNNPSYYTTDDDNIHLQDPTKEGYEFVAWKYNDEIIDIIDVNLVQDITLEAVWSDYEYEIREDDNGKYAVIIGYDDSITDVIIPENIILNGEEIPVKEISQTAFKDNQKVRSITVSDKVTTIDEYAFAGCTSLESIYIPNSVTTIGSSAFRDCSNLTTVTFGENSQLTSIGGYAFYNCSSLTSIYIPDSVTTIGSYAFSGCSNLTIYCEASSQPSGWDSSWNYSGRPVVWSSNGQYGEYSDFTYGVAVDDEGNPYIVITGYNGSSIDIVIPSSINVNGEDIPVKVITNDAFKDNDTITSVTISDNVTTIGNSAFRGCSSLTSVVIPDNVTTIGSSAFRDCSNLTTVTFVENSQLTSIGGYAFYNCDSLTSIYIPDSVTTIGSRAFEGCTNLTIYCEASSKPSGWDSSWNSFNRPVIWNTTYDEYLVAIA